MGTVWSEMESHSLTSIRQSSLEQILLPSVSFPEFQIFPCFLSLPTENSEEPKVGRWIQVSADPAIRMIMSERIAVKRMAKGGEWRSQINGHILT
jgi:hypothetical protein